MHFNLAIFRKSLKSLNLSVAKISCNKVSCVFNNCCFRVCKVQEEETELKAHKEDRLVLQLITLWCYFFKLNFMGENQIQMWLKICQSINQSIDQSINQSIDQSIS